ncbi:S-layer homology domain-containing protein [Pseudobacteroides cellulosolvens]|nr:S-layer homology domain-containing protein [Pseudobacteroides cellulosolvens]
MNKRLIKRIALLIVVPLLANMLVTGGSVSANTSDFLQNVAATTTATEALDENASETTPKTTPKTTLEMNSEKASGEAAEPIIDNIKTNTNMPYESSVQQNGIVLPLIDKKEGTDSDASLKKSTTAKADILRQVLPKEVKTGGILSKSRTLKSLSSMDIPDDAINVNENEVKILNENSSEYKSYYTFVFTPDTTDYYKITASSIKIPYIYVNDSQNNTIGWNRTYPQMSDSIACKMYKGQQYLINLSSVSSDDATEFSVKKYRSNANSFTYTFVDNTYTGDENASIVVTLPNISADKLYGILDRDILIRAELFKGDELIDKISEIPAQSIRGAMGTPDDNILQFVCEFGRAVEHDEYTIKITCYDNEGNIVIDTCESIIEVGSSTFLYVPSQSIVFKSNSYNGQQRVYFKGVNTDKGKFIVFDGDRIIGTSADTSTGSTYTQHEDLFENYYSINHYEYDTSKFVKKLYYADIPDLSFVEPLQEGKDYKLKMVAGVGEFGTNAKIIPTKGLVLNNISYDSLYNSSSKLTVYAEFYNFGSIKPNDISVELIDLAGEIVASQVDYAYDSYYSGTDNITYIRYNLRINKPLEATKKYSVRINYLGKLYLNTAGTYIEAYPNGDYLNLKSPTVLDAEKLKISIPTYQCDNKLDYDVILYRESQSLSVPISQVTGAKPDNNGTFVIDFPQDNGLPILIPGASYYIEFKYKRPSYNNEVVTSSIGFSMPQTTVSNVSKNITFYPPALPAEGEIEFTISGYEIENGIMGTDNSKINIELVANNEIYGSVIKDTIKKSASLYDVNSHYSMSQIMISGKLQLQKALVDDVQYFIRINGSDYEYFYKSSKPYIDENSLNIQHYCSYSTYKNSLGTDCLLYDLSFKEPLELNYGFIKNVPEDYKLVLKDAENNQEIELGTWKTEKTYFDGEYKDISIEVDLSQVAQDRVFELCLKAGENFYSLNKFIKLIKPYEAPSFSVHEAVYGSDRVTLSLPLCYDIDSLSFDVKDSFDMVYDLSVVPGSLKRDSDAIYMDVKTDIPLSYGGYTLRMYGADNTIKYTVQYTVSQKSSSPFIDHIKNGVPYLIYGKDLSDEGVYTADITDYNNVTRVKGDITLTKKHGENVLELDENSLQGLPIGNYNVAVKLNGSTIGVAYFYYSGPMMLKPLISAKEWIDSPEKSPLIASNNVELIIKTMYYNKVRFAESLEKLKEMSYQPVTNSINYKFENAGRIKLLYFQFADDNEKESEILTFKAYLASDKNEIKVISPEKDKTYENGLPIYASVSNNPHSVWLVLYWQGAVASMAKATANSLYSSTDIQYVKLSKDDANDFYSYEIPQDSAGNLIKFEIYSADVFGNITDTKTVDFREIVDPEPVTAIQISNLAPAYKKQNITISGSNATTGSNVTIYAYPLKDNGSSTGGYPYLITVIANEEGKFEGSLNIPKDGYYRIYITDNMGRTSYNYHQTWVDTMAPVLRDYNTIAQGVNSVRISWDVNDRSNCNYTLWRDGKIIENQYREKYYVATGLTKGQTYTYKVMATDLAGNQSEAAQIIVTVGDTIAPETPKYLHISSNAGRSITLSWEPSTDNSYVAGYEIYRNDEKIGVSYTTSYTDSNLVKGIEYSYRIKAFDPSMNYSGLSEPVVHSIQTVTVKDAYDGSYNVVASTNKTLVLKAITSDILNNTNIRVVFAYSNDKGANWTRIATVSQYTTTPDGLLFSTIWSIDGYESGEYIIRYTVIDVDSFTNQDFSKPITIQKTDDFINPTIKSIWPYPSCYANSIPLCITAEDNVGVKSITIQESMDGAVWEDVTSVSMSYINKISTVNYNLDVSEIREGPYYIRAIAADTSGNNSNSTGAASYNQYIIDRTAPQKVSDVSVSSTVDYIELKWGMNSEPYVKGFDVLRAESINGEYITLAANSNTLNFIDQSAKTGVTYYYKVSCTDIAGNTGETSEPVKAVRLSIDDITDDLPPQITSIYPNNNAVIGNKLNLAVTAMDNIRLSKIAAQFKTGENDWTDLMVFDTAYSSDGFSAELDTSKYPAGTVIKVRAYAVDAKGNKSSFEYADYTVDNVPPKTPVVDVVARNMGIYVSWSCEDEDIAVYKVYRRISGSSFYTLIGEYSKSANNVLDTSLDPSCQYVYKVIAIDGLGNTSFKESRAISPLDVDDIMPQAVINCISSAEMDAVVEFDGTSSYDNVKIAKYEWDFGDGKTMEGSTVKHQFSNVGTYSVVLKVTDTSGNQSLTSRLVTIIKKGVAGTVEVSIIDDQGNRLPFTDVFVNLGEADQYKSTSDSTGSLSLNMEPGTYKIGAYKSGYAPSQQEVLVIAGKSNTLKLVLKKSEVVIGSMTATKMTLDEIKKAGIDVTAPGNQNVFRYQINLVYQNKPYTITHIANTSNSSYVSSSSIGDRTLYVSTVPRSGSSGSAPVTVLLDVPGGTSWLKDFFDVKLHLVNTQGAYDIENCVVNLNIPSGLSIAGGSAKTTEIGTLPANSGKVLNWIIRGDNPGSYNISADFSGILESFNETISARFAPAEPIKVEDSSRLKLFIEVEEVKYPNDKLLYRVGFKNERNSDLYRPKISMQDSEYIRSYKTSTSMALINTSHEVLKPGEILWSEYSIDPAKFEGNNNVGLKLTEYASTALGGMKIPIEIRPVEYGTFGRVKPTIYVIDPHTGRETETDSIDLIRYRSRANDVMPDLKIKTGRGISKDVVVKEACKLTIGDGLFDVTQEITTDKNGEYIYKGGSIDAVKINDSGKGYFSIKVTSDTKISDTLGIRVLDQNLLSETEFGSVSGRVWNKDESKPVSGATVIIGSNTRTTDANGNFSFNDIMFDGDTITVKAAGFPEKNIDRDLRDGSYVTVYLSKVPEITKVVSWCSSSSNYRSSIVPLNLIGSSVNFRIDTDLKGNGEVTEYIYKIVDKNGNEKYSGSETDQIVTIWDIKNRMAIGDRLKFAIKTSGPYGDFTSNYVDAKLVMAPELKILDTVDWLFDSGVIPNELSFNPEIEGINDANEFLNGSDSNVPFPGDSGIFCSTKLIPINPSIDMDVEYDFLNAKVTITNKGGVSGEFLGGLAEWDHGSDGEGSRRINIGGELSATFDTVLTYNDAALRWELERMDVNVVTGASFTVEFKYSVPLDVYFGGALLSGYAAVELEGGVQLIVNASIPDVSSFDSISDLVTEVQANLHLGIKGAIGAEVGYGLLSGEFFVKGELDVNVPTWRTELTLSYGVGYGYLWFFSDENTLGEKTWVLYQGNQNRRMSGMLAAPPNVANEGIVYKSAPRGYLQNQKWVGKEEIIKDAYPDSSAKISAVDKKIGDMLMVYIGDDSKRTDNNRTSVYSSVYRDGTWSQPVQIDIDGTGDAYPSLAADGENIYASWLDMEEEMGASAAMSEDDITKNVLGKMGISIAKFDAGTKSWKEQISKKTEGIIKLPEIAANDGKVMAVWVNNGKGSLKGNLEQPDDLYYVYNDGSGWSEPKAFVTGAANVTEGKLYMYNGKAYYVFVTNAYSDEGINKAYVTRFDGKSWSNPTELIDNSNEDSHTTIALYNEEPTAFWQNDGTIYKVSLERPYGAQIIINSTQVEGVLELSAANTEKGVALAWTSASAGEKKLYISTFDEESSSWTEGTMNKFNTMEIPKGITLAGLGDSVTAVYNKSQYKFDEDKKIYYRDNTSLTSTNYIRKADLAILENGVYFENGKPLPGEDTTVIATVKNVGDITVKGIKVSLYESDKLVAVKDMPEAILSPGNSVLASFPWKVQQNASGFKLKAVVEAADDSDPINNAATLEKSYTDVEITGVYNELYSKNSGTVFVDVKNSGYSSLDKVKVYISTDKEFKNIIAEKEIKDINPLMDKKVAFQFKPTDEQIENRVKLYAKVEALQSEYDYSNNIDFTVIRPMEDPDGTGIIEDDGPSPTPTPTPTPTPGQNQNNTTIPVQTPGTSDKGNGDNGNNQTDKNNPTDEPKDNGTKPSDKPVIVVPTPDVPSTGGENKKNVPYMKGFTDKTFRPDKGLTRAEMAVILANLDGVSQKQTESLIFKDVKNNHWAAWAISYVTEKGIFNGYSDKTYRPDNFITRAELSVVLSKYISIKAIDKGDTKLNDIDKHWAKGYIMGLVSGGYIKGYPDGTFKPANNVKRSECVSIINRILGIAPLKSSEPSFIDVAKKHWAYGDIMAATSPKVK